MTVQLVGELRPVGLGCCEVQIRNSVSRASRLCLRVALSCLLVAGNLLAGEVNHIPDFETEVQPILAARGCSTGACHGKQGGKNGFQLSLFGFDHDFDYASLTQQGRGRRISVAAPEQSLLLQKATAVLPHGGGVRFQHDDPHYELLRDWVRAGAPRFGSRPVKLTGIQLAPDELIMAPGSQAGLRVTATFSDGSRRDVTDLTAFSSNEAAVAAVDGNAMVTASPLAGEAAIMARFMDQIETCNVLLPRVDAVESSY